MRLEGYLAASHAARIDLPQDNTIEHLANGAMLMSAVADEIFNGEKFASPGRSAAHPSGTRPAQQVRE